MASKESPNAPFRHLGGARSGEGKRRRPGHQHERRIQPRGEGTEPREPRSTTPTLTDHEDGKEARETGNKVPGDASDADTPPPGGGGQIGGREGQSSQESPNGSNPWKGHGRGRGRGDAPSDARATKPATSRWFHMAARNRPTPRPGPWEGPGGGAGWVRRLRCLRRPGYWGLSERHLRRSGHQLERRIHPPPAGDTWQARKLPTPRPGPWEGPGGGGVWLCDACDACVARDTCVACDALGTSKSDGPGGGWVWSCDACDALGTRWSDVTIRLSLLPRGRPGNHQYPVPALGRVRAGVGCGRATPATHWAPAGATWQIS
ncbi:hypothetical protein GWK47_003092 [Chionoecetes opilio]|uniref:Uncharacterized protein n=1 Tax=Chionoecetes opilio TaxID=41210 RepID=A0A8J8WMS1_CHIOP|nr:hypothetical protein GWK47_003092 [Chionoecetes opilio]